MLLRNFAVWGNKEIGFQLLEGNGLRVVAFKKINK